MRVLLRALPRALLSLLLHAQRASALQLAPPGSGIRVVCCDVDGTLLTPQHEISARTVEAAMAVMDRGILFCACTGRGRAAALSALGPLGERLRSTAAPGVYLQGLQVFGGEGILLDEKRLSPAIVREVAGFAEARGVSLIGYSGDGIVCAREDEWTELVSSRFREPSPRLSGSWDEIADTSPVNKMIFLAPPDEIAGIRPHLAAALSEGATLTQALPEMLEVLPRGGNKGDGVATLLRHLGVPPSEVLALGDAENDLEMLKLAGTSVAMGNAAPNVQAAAGFVTATNSADGAAQALERFLLSC